MEHNLLQLLFCLTFTISSGQIIQGQERKKMNQNSKKIK